MAGNICKLGPVISIYNFYRDGLRSMTLGRTLWKLIFIKLFIIFLVFKLFFFPDVMQKHFFNDEQRAEHVMNVLTSQTHGLSHSRGVDIERKDKIYKRRF